MKPITDMLHWVEATPLALFVAQSAYGFSALDMFHVAAISVVFGICLLYTSPSPRDS